MTVMTRRLSAVRGLIEPEQGLRLAELARGVPAGAPVVEIGSHTGLSTCYLGLNARSHVFAVDPWGPPRPGSRDDPFDLADKVYDEFSTNLTNLGLWSKVTPLRATSVEVARMWMAPVGLLFIDAVHTEAGVRSDLAAWSDKIIKGGWLALHDYDNNPEHEYYGVSVVADELARSGDWQVAPLVGSLWTGRKR